MLDITWANENKEAEGHSCWVGRGRVWICALLTLSIALILYCTILGMQPSKGDGQTKLQSKGMKPKSCDDFLEEATAPTQKSCQISVHLVVFSPLLKLLRVYFLSNLRFFYEYKEKNENTNFPQQLSKIYRTQSFSLGFLRFLVNMPWVLQEKSFSFHLEWPDRVVCPQEWGSYRHVT